MQLSEGFTKTFNIPISHLDFDYIEKCSDNKELEKIYLTLKNGEEGKYPDLEKCCEEKLRKLCPQSRVLRKPSELKTVDQLEKEQRDQLSHDFQTWLTEMQVEEKSHTNLGPTERGDSGPTKNYPIRNKQSISTTEPMMSSSEKKVPQKSCKPKDYNEWSKIADQLEKQIIVEEAEETEQQQQSKTEAKVEAKKEIMKTAQLNNLSSEVDTEGMSELEKEKRAVAEKDKGNEAFRAGDLEEADIYYCRSLSIVPNPIVYNNRGLIYMKQKKWEEAIRDFNITIKHEPSNIKALMRRASCYSEIHNLQDSIIDCQKVIKLSPNNKPAETLLTKVQEELQQRAQPKLKDGRRMVITEIDSDEENSDEEVSIDKKIPKKLSNTDIIQEESKVEIEVIPKEAEVIPDQDSSEETFTKLKDHGNELFKELKYNEALDIYNELTRRWPTNPIGFRNKAACNLMLEQPEEVIKDCTAAIALDSTSHLSFYRRGKAYKILQRYDESFLDLEKALEISPNHKQINEELNEVKAFLYQQQLSVDKTKTVEKLVKDESSISSAKIIDVNEESVIDSQRVSPVSGTWEFLENSDFPKSEEFEYDHGDVPTLQRSSPQETMTKIEFDKKLSLMKIKYEWQSVIQLLVDASPPNLVKLMGNKLDGFILEHIISSLVIYSRNKNNVSFIKNTLEQLEKVQRFCFVKLMVSDHTVDEIEQLFEFLMKNSDNLAEIDCLKLKYQ